jgi:hypothetical protein
MSFLEVWTDVPGGAAVLKKLFQRLLMDSFPVNSRAKSNSRGLPVIFGFCPHWVGGCGQKA